MRSEWCRPGDGSTLRELSIFLGVYVGEKITDAQLDAPTSLLLLSEGKPEEKDRRRLAVVVERILEHGKDGGW